MGGGLAGNRRTVRPSPPYLKMSYNVKKKRKKKEFSVRKSNNYDKSLHYGVEYVNLSKLCAPKGFSFLTSAEFLLKGLLTNTTTKKPTIVNRAFSLTWPHLCKFIGTKGVVYIRRKFDSHRTGLDTNMAAVSLFWNTNMAAVTSCENTLWVRSFGMIQIGISDPRSLGSW